MKDYSELKKLAEEFPEDLDFDRNNEPFFNGPSGESLGGGSTGFYSVYGKPFLIDGDDYEYDGPTYVEACNLEFAKFMIASRDGVLELIAEVEGLLAQHGRDSAELRSLCQARDGARKERDQLKAANEQLTEAIGNQTARRFVGDDDQRKIDDLVAAGIREDKRLIGQLKAKIEQQAEEYDKAWRHDLNDKNNVQVLAAEVDALRKDAERYRWLRDNDFDIGSFHPAHEHNHQSWFEYFDDESIDYNLSMKSK